MKLQMSKMHPQNNAMRGDESQTGTYKSEAVQWALKNKSQSLFSNVFSELKIKIFEIACFRVEKKNTNNLIGFTKAMNG